MVAYEARHWPRQHKVLPSRQRVGASNGIGRDLLHSFVLLLLLAAVAAARVWFAMPAGVSAG